ncbi:type VI secretion system Vgr family protein [Nautilia lithotrophica]
MKYFFKLKNIPVEFQVVRFSSYEAISEIYRYEIELISKTLIEDDEILMQEALFEMKFLHNTEKINGIVAEFEEMGKIEDFYYYKIILKPRIFQMSINKDSEVFLDKSIVDIFKEIFSQYGFNNSDYEFNLINEYEKKEYVCQYQESDFDFISRWCEREGIYFYFEQGEKEKVVFVDSKYSNPNFPYNNIMYYSPVSGVEGENIYKSLQKLSVKNKREIRNVKIKDYNPEKPSYNLQTEITINEKGSRDIYVYEQHFKTLEEGQKLAKIIGEGYDVYSKLFTAKATIPNIYPGYVYKLENHYKDEYVDYFIILLAKKSGVGDTFVTDKINLFNVEFEMIKNSKQYRRKFLTRRPKINGVLLAKIDGETEKTPYIDNEGRYKVIMPFDTKSRQNGKASCWIRLMQPAGGGNKGFHFPLKKGSEVAVAFVHGDPDRPVILGSLPNPLNPNVVSMKNAMQNVIRSEENMRFIMDDEKKLIQFISGDGKSFIKIH